VVSSLNFSAELVEQLVQRGHDAKMGARPIQRTIEQLVVAPLSEYLTRRPNLGQGTRLQISWDQQLVIEADQ
jgi:ATP-dependent Clp protease ATP-binding subunit ClpC